MSCGYDALVYASGTTISYATMQILTNQPNNFSPTELFEACCKIGQSIAVFQPNMVQVYKAKADDLFFPSIMHLRCIGQNFDHYVACQYQLVTMPNVYLCSQHKIAKLQRTCFARAVMWDETYELKKPIDSDINLLVEYSLAL